MSNSDNKIETIYSLTPLQEGMLYYKILNNASTTYVNQSILRVCGDFKGEYIRQSFRLLSQKYDVLRTLILYKHTQKPWQVVLIERDPDIKEIDLSDISSYDVEKEIQNLADADVRRGFDLEKDPLLRATLIKVSENKSVILWTSHHIILDGWCNSLLFRDFIQYYMALNDKRSYEEMSKVVQEQKKEITSYKDYVGWLALQDKDAGLNYFRNLLLGYNEPAEIIGCKSSDFSTTGVRNEKFQIDKKISEAIQKLSAICNVTYNTIFEASWGRLLQCYKGNNDVVFGKVVSGRGAKLTGIDQAVGLFINTIPVRISQETNTTASELLKRTQEQAIASTAYEYCSLAEVQNVSELDSNLIKTLFVFENYYIDDFFSGEQSGENKLSGFRVSIEKRREETNYPIVMQWAAKGNEFYGCLQYDSSLYSKDDIELMKERYMLILKEFAEHPDEKVEDITVLTKQEQKQLFEVFNDIEAGYPENKTIVDLFEEQVEKTPDHIAIVYEGSKLTYRELNARANALAHKLRGLGIRPDDFIAMYTERSIEMVIGIYGILKAGGAYVPINTIYPRERIEFILKDSCPKALLVYDTAIATDIPVIDLKELKLWEDSTNNPEHINKAQDLAYCIYTSGTTGLSKGVLIEHRNVVRLFVNDRFQFDFKEKDVWLLFHSYGFDFSVWEMYGATLFGGKLIVVPSETMKDNGRLIDLIEKEGVTVLNQVPSSFYSLLQTDYAQRKLSVRYLIFGGEELDPRRLTAWIDHFPETKMINMYGITETTVHVTYRELGRKEIERGISDIGRAIPTLSVYIMNGDRPCGIGIPGELCVTGAGLARGYLNRPQLTAEKFVENPFGTGRMYRSGDLARWLPDGNLEYLGRIDEQVKIRGYRIELGEIASQIRKIEYVKDCAVITRMDKGGEKAIYAYIIADQEINVTEIRKRLSRTLPEYMIPAYLMRIDAIPVTGNGKLNKRALPDIGDRGEKEYAAPGSITEELICKIFSEITGMKNVGINDDFFEIGGHSLRAITLVNQIAADTKNVISLRDMFLLRTPAQIAKYIDLCEKENYSPIPDAKEKEYYPMSSTQKRIYLICQMEEEKLTYNMPVSLKLKGEISPEAMQAAMQKMVDRHEILRTEFLMKDGELLQRIHESVEADFEYKEDDTATDKELMEGFLRPFDLKSAKLVRAKLVNRGAYWLLMTDIHHIISDGMSQVILIKELIGLYSGKELSPLTKQYKDYSEWMYTRDLSVQRNFWVKEYSDEFPVLNMPLDYNRPQVQSYNGAAIVVNTGKKLFTDIKAFVKENDVTEYMVFLSAAMVLLSKYSRQTDIVIGSPISGRVHHDTEQMLGMFVNTLAMRGKPEGCKTYSEFLTEIKEFCLKAYENQEYPFEELVEAVDIKRDLSRNPLFDVMLVLQNNDTVEDKISGIEAEKCSLERKIAKFDLTYSITEKIDNYEISIEYCTALYKKESIEALAAHYLEVLSQVINCVAIRIDDIKVITAQEEYRILGEFNHSAVKYQTDKTIVELLEEQVKKRPDSIAIAFGEETVTYAKLNERANVLGWKLRELGVKEEDFVVILAEKSNEMIEGIYGILKSGAAYVPIDTSYPEDRIKAILNDCMPKAVLLYHVSIKTDIPVINLERADTWQGRTDNPEHIAQAFNLAYCIYTSGSTGRPKGSLIENRSVVRLVKNPNFMILDETTVVLQTGSIAFDASILEVWGALLNGGRLVLAANDVIMNGISLKAQLSKYEVNTMWLTSTLYNQMIQDNQELFSNLKYLLIGGEKLSDVHVRMFKELHNETKLINGYGPTENTTFTTTYEIPEAFEKIPIGKPINATQVYIMDNNHLCGIGVPGELCTTGDGVSRGYLNMPELTKEKFVRNPFGEGKMYRTGDLARWLFDGTIEYLGRIDEQIKIRGFRIEPGDIESALNSLEAVKECAVIVKENCLGEKALYAYIVSDNEVDLAKLKNRLRSLLPEYMIPPYMTKLEALPVTDNGKLNKRALPAIEEQSDFTYTKPRNRSERLLCEAFQSALGIVKVGIDDDFYNIGGDSLKLIKVISYLSTNNITVGLRDIMTYRTPRSIAENILPDDNNTSGALTANQFSSIVYTPYLKMCFSQCRKKSEEAGISIMLKSGIRFERSILKAAIEHVVWSNELMSAINCVEQKVFKYSSSRDNQKFKINFYDFRDELDNQSLSELIKSTIKTVNSDVSMKATVLSAVVFNLSEGDHLYLQMSSFVYDLKSVAVTAENILRAYYQLVTYGRITPDNDVIKYSEWVEKINEYTLKSAEDRQYWEKLNASILQLKDIFNKNSDSETERKSSHRCFLTQEETESLISLCGMDKVPSYLLSVAAMAISKISKKDRLAILYCQDARHIRETNGEYNSFAAGTYTNAYPVILQIENSLDETMNNVYSAIHEAPNSGFSYSGYYEKAQNAALPEIEFSFFGNIDDVLNYSVVYSEHLAPEKYLSAVKGFCPLLISTVIMNGILLTQITNEKGMLSDKLMAEFITEYTDIIQTKLSEYNREDLNFTSKDNAYRELLLKVKEEEDQFTASVMKGRVIKTYPLNGIQKLSYHLKIREAKLSIPFFEEVDRERLDIVFNAVLNKYEMLRCSINVGLRNGTIFLYDKASDIRIPFIDLSGKCHKEKQRILNSLIRYLDCFGKNECYKGKKLMELIALVKISNQNYRFILSCSHLIMEDYSIDILKQEITKMYYSDAKEEGPKADEYGKYIELIPKADEKELLRECELLDFKKACQRFTKKLGKAKFKNIRYEYFLKKEGDGRDISKLIEISHNLYASAMHFIFPEEDIPVMVLAIARLYDDCNFSDSIGEYLDILPMLLHKDEQTQFSDVIKKHTAYANKNKIKFASLLLDQGLKSTYPEVKKIFRQMGIGFIMKRNRSIPIYNNLGMYRSLQGLDSHNIFYEEREKREGNTTGCMLGCNIQISESKIELFIAVPEELQSSLDEHLKKTLPQLI